MGNVAHVQIVGQLVRDPEVKDIKKGQVSYHLASFSVAVNTKHRGEDVTSYFDCAAWESHARVIEK